MWAFPQCPKIIYTRWHQIRLMTDWSTPHVHYVPIRVTNVSLLQTTNKESIGEFKTLIAAKSFKTMQTELRMTMEWNPLCCAPPYLCLLYSTHARSGEIHGEKVEREWERKKVDKHQCTIVVTHIVWVHRQMGRLSNGPDNPTHSPCSHS